LENLRARCAEITPDTDPKIAALTKALEAIAEQAEAQALGDDDARQKRKVIVFSFFADTVAYIREHLELAVARNPKLAAYRGRVVAVAGSLDVDKGEYGRKTAVEGFAPISTEATSSQDLFDILISTDILAEGVNLQQCRNIINFDIPWNPMRVVQRHGRIDRIGSEHQRVFLRTIFPADRLDHIGSLARARRCRNTASAAFAASARR